ncbi:MAG: cupin domain-containing protein [Ardenticatenaceae bacterium]
MNPIYTGTGETTDSDSFESNSSFVQKTMHPGDELGTHWHSNAVELVLWISGGEVTVTITPPSERGENHEWVPGLPTDHSLTTGNDLLVIPRGYPHSIRNNSSEDAVIKLIFDTIAADSFVYDLDSIS